MATVHDYFEALMEGDQQRVQAYVETDLKEGISPHEILHSGLIPGFEKIGEKFTAAEIYIPEVLVTARAMHAGLDTLRPKLVETGTKTSGKIVIGTVHGDLHDIGKNLVALMLEGTGFQVINMGVDVPTEKFQEAINTHRPDILALSALLTTTMVEMKKTIEDLKQKGVLNEVKVLVGGAPVTQGFADEIGADGYASDAALAVVKAKELFKTAHIR